MTMYEKIRYCRELLELSQLTLAEYLGYKDRSTIAKIEAGRVDLAQSKILAFARILDVDPEWLMGFSEPWHEDCIREFNEADAEERYALYHLYGTDTRVLPAYYAAKRIVKGYNVVPKLIPLKVWPRERDVIFAYRSKPELQGEVDRVLQINPSEPVELKYAARGQLVPPDGPIDPSELDQALSELPPDAE